MLPPPGSATIPAAARHGPRGWLLTLALLWLGALLLVAFIVVHEVTGATVHTSTCAGHPEATPRREPHHEQITAPYYWLTGPDRDYGCSPKLPQRH